jgi:hypothetical protein
MTDRDITIRTIRTNLRNRGLKWVSVTGGRGTAWGWIHIGAVPSARPTPYAGLTEEQCQQLAAALSLEPGYVCQYVGIPASDAYREEYIARSAGETPARFGAPYWD